ncbi:MAG: hypothetical protein U5L04_07320 [Trueperaceae bacterium]|nr:hypothetical protein [Trueperaceae bacterium]
MTDHTADAARGVQPLRGHDEARALLGALRHRGVQTLLFTGPSGVGRRRLARWYAQLVNCAAPQHDEPCGRCESCRVFAVDEHPDYREIAPEATTKTGRVSRDPQLRIDDLVARQGGNPDPLAPWLRTRPRYRYRVGVIDRADTLNMQAANAFLKMLEEPPSYALIILIAPSPQAVLSTIASRSTPLRLGTLDTPELAAELGLEHPAARLGRPGALLRALGDRDNFAVLVGQIDDYLAALRDDLDAALTRADVLEKAWSNETTFDVAELLCARLSARAPHHYAPALAAVHRCEEALGAYGSPSLAFQVLTLELREIIDRAR